MCDNKTNGFYVFSLGFRNCAAYYITQMENATFEDLLQMIFVEWVLHDPEEIKKAKARLCDVCPHHNIVDDYVECGLEHGKYIKYCDVCMKCL